jgi:predicted DNA-binding transcriptional regulator AlpA
MPERSATSRGDYGQHDDPDLALLVDVHSLAKILNVGRNTVWKLHSTGVLGPMPIRLGRRTLWRREEIERWVKAGCPSRDRWLTITED